MSPRHCELRPVGSNSHLSGSGTYDAESSFIPLMIRRRVFAVGCGNPGATPNGLPMPPILLRGQNQPTGSTFPVWPARDATTAPPRGSNPPAANSFHHGRPIRAVATIPGPPLTVWRTLSFSRRSLDFPGGPLRSPPPAGDNRSDSGRKPLMRNKQSPWAGTNWPCEHRCLFSLLRYDKSHSLQPLG